MVTGWGSHERSERFLFYPRAQRAGFVGAAGGNLELYVLMDAHDNHLAQHNIHHETQSPCST
eukprot:1460120-Prymnesium_polylepis.1